jgi:hypothetical protein
LTSLEEELQLALEESDKDAREAIYEKSMAKYRTDVHGTWLTMLQQASLLEAETHVLYGCIYIYGFIWFYI